MRVTILDYGVGNLHSVSKAIALTGVSTRVVSDVREALDGDALVLPGVGAFTPAAASLAAAREELRDAILGGLPTLGICLGMQLLFDSSEEGPGQGLGVIRGTTRRLQATRVPHIGWNAIQSVGASPALADIEWAYYANSYVCEPDDESVVLAWTDHEQDRFPAAVRAGSAFGVQFHPEKSSTEGTRLFQRIFAELAA
jgi:glutamine amidotransferase